MFINNPGQDDQDGHHAHTKFYPRSRMRVYRTIGPLVCLIINNSPWRSPYDISHTEDKKGLWHCY